MKKKQTTFLVIGLGSMGKRRIRNLHTLGEQNIIGFDFSLERRAEAEKEYGIKTTADIESLPLGSFDALIISTPPHAHGDYIRFALKKKKHFFTEVGTSDDGYADIFSAPQGIVMAPSCTFRFSTPIKMIQTLLGAGRIGSVLAFNYHVGQYLPDWHPWEDYRTVFFSKKETGACRELFPFELSWLNTLVHSRPVEVSGVVRKISSLEMDADDILMAHLRYQNASVGSVLIEVLSRTPVRNLTVLGTSGTIEWRSQERKIFLYTAVSKKTAETIVPQEDSDAMYVEEIGAFLKAMGGRVPYPYTFREEHTNITMLKNLITYA